MANRPEKKAITKTIQTTTIPIDQYGSGLLSTLRRSIFEIIARTANARESSRIPRNTMIFAVAQGALYAPGEPDPRIAAGPTSGRTIAKTRNDKPDRIVNTDPTTGREKNDP